MNLLNPLATAQATYAAVMAPRSLSKVWWAVNDFANWPFGRAIPATEQSRRRRSKDLRRGAAFSALCGGVVGLPGLIGGIASTVDGGPPSLLGVAVWMGFVGLCAMDAWTKRNLAARIEAADREVSVFGQDAAAQPGRDSKG